MRYLLVILLLTGLVGAGDPASVPADKPLALVGVHVVTLDEDEVQRDRTLLVRDGKIERVGPRDEVAVPAEYVRIEGGGRFVSPGLCDMHVHVWTEDALFLFVANGVTTVRNMWGTPMQLGWRAAIAGGRMLGPRVYTTGPILDGQPPIWRRSTVVRNAAEAMAQVQLQKAAGYDFLKVYSRLSPGAYQAILDEAAKAGMPVVGHVPHLVGLEKVLSGTQQTIEHLEGYADWTGRINSARIDEYVAATAKTDVVNCPTLVVFENISRMDALDELRARAETRYVSRETLAGWDPKRDFRLRHLKASGFASMRKNNETRRELVGALHKAGLPIVLGTDVGNPFVVPGFSAHDELALLVRSGLKPIEALRAATVVPAKVLNAEKSWGRIAEGLFADFVLVEGNPAEDLARLRRPAAVIVAGRFLSRTELDRRLERIAAKNAAPRDRFRDVPVLEGWNRPKKSGEWRARFEIVFDGTVVGEERCLTDENRRVRSQQVRGDSNPVVRLATIAHGPDGRMTNFSFAHHFVAKRSGADGASDLRCFGGAARGHFTLNTNRPAPRDCDRWEWRDNSLLYLPCVATAVSWAFALSALAQGDKRDLEVSFITERLGELVWARQSAEVRRLGDNTYKFAGRETRVSVYRITSGTTAAATEHTLLVDGESYPLSLSVRAGGVTRTWRRVE